MEINDSDIEPMDSENHRKDDDEGLRILYFYPHTFSHNERMKQVGVSQALVNFIKYCRRFYTLRTWLMTNSS